MHLHHSGFSFQTLVCVYVSLEVFYLFSCILGIDFRIHVCVLTK